MLNKEFSDLAKKIEQELMTKKLMFDRFSFTKKYPLIEFDKYEHFSYSYWHNTSKRLVIKYGDDLLKKLPYEEFFQHEIAHFVECPPSRIFKLNWGLEVKQGEDIPPTWHQRAAERELRVSMFEIANPFGFRQVNHFELIKVLAQNHVKGYNDFQDACDKLYTYYQANQPSVTPELFTHNLTERYKLLEEKSKCLE